MSITKEEVKFRSQFWGQQVLCYDNTDSYIVDEHNILCSPMYISAKKLSWLSIEEAKIIARKLDLTFDKPGYLRMESFKESLIDMDFRCLFSIADLLPAYQILQAWGYLLPLTYFDKNGQLVTLTPDEIVSKKWASFEIPTDKNIAF